MSGSLQVTAPRAVASTTGFSSLSATCRATGLSATTLRNLSNSKMVACLTLPSGHRRWNIPQVLAQLGHEVAEDDLKENGQGKICAYIRTSTRKQITSLANQEADIRAKYPTLCVYRDVGSGFSDTRKNYVKLIREILTGRSGITKVVITRLDRLSRFQQHTFRLICEAHGVELEEVQPEKLDDDWSADMRDLLNLVQVYANRRSAKFGGLKVMKKIDEKLLESLRERKRSGMSAHDIWCWCVENEVKTDKGDCPSYYLVHRLLRDVEAVSLGSFDSFREACLKRDPPSKVKIPDLYARYETWCRKHKQRPISKSVIGRRWVAQQERRRSMSEEYIGGWAWRERGEKNGQ